jgi:predicted DCC family thiol-disulfide oxidoreductase YuxK
MMFADSRLGKALFLTIVCIPWPKFIMSNFKMPTDKEYAVVLFDGVCHLCDGAVRFILRRENSTLLRFAPLQSEAGKALLMKYGYPENYLDGMIFIENKRAHDRSSACLRIAGKLKLPWRVFFVFLLVPKPLRDLVYRIVAVARYRWFGKKEVCSLPQGEDPARFL